MALIACTECGHRISSLARFCPKCYHTEGAAKNIAPPVTGSSKQQPQDNAFIGDTANINELLQHEFKPSLDEMVILEGRAFLITGLFNTVECYSYLTSKRFVLCDDSRSTITFQVGSNDIVCVEEGRHIFSNKIMITASSGETVQVKSQPHHTWLNALREPGIHALAPKIPGSNQLNGSGNILHWYYETTGTTTGPITEHVIVQLIQNNHTIYRHTKVWNASLPEWKRADETILSIYFSDSVAAVVEKPMNGHSPQNFLSPISRFFRRFC